jgi:putative spermidine/putrescine transport system substrate-binding protein
MVRWCMVGMVVMGLVLGAGAGTRAAAPIQFATYGMPHETVWALVIDAFCKKHHCTHVDTDMGSAEAITKFVAERSKPVAYATEVGIAFGPVAVQRGAAMMYKNANWDKIPWWAKDAEGGWFAVYAGVPTFLVNPRAVKAVPASWRDLLHPDYRRTFAIKDPRTSGTALATVLAANAAMGGTLTNLDPGIAYFKQLKEMGILSPTRVSDSNIQKGEIPITVKYDHENLVLREALKNELRLEIVVPSDGTIYAPSVLVLNRYAPDQALARAFADFVTSDEGQLLVARAYPRPIRYVAGNLKVPDDIRARWLPGSAYGTRVRKVFEWEKFSIATFVEKWAKEVAP